MNITKTPIWLPADRRRLRVDYLHYPRGFRAAHFHWDLDKGFRLEVLGQRSFWLALQGGAEEPVVCRAQGEQDFLLYVARDCDGRWPGWERARLAAQTICVILSEKGRACKPPSDWPNLVLWVRQSMPEGTRWTGNDFFTPEQILHQWGRVGRRVQRRARWRRWIPW